MIILSAALDLVPPSVPKGVILFCNIAPALVAKVAWPYILKGRIRYVKRLTGCCLLSSLGMLVSSCGRICSIIVYHCEHFDSFLLAYTPDHRADTCSLASGSSVVQQLKHAASRNLLFLVFFWCVLVNQRPFSDRSDFPHQGLGELTFLQLSTTYSPPSVAGYSVGYVI